MKEYVYRYRFLERSILGFGRRRSVLDLGCGSGDNLRRLARYGAFPRGVDPSVSRLREARAIAPVVAGWGEALPLRDGSFDLVYVSHVLHHARDPDRVLRECDRVLRPGGLLFLIETVDDSPLMRLARWLRPRWEGDEVLNRFRFRELSEQVGDIGLEVRLGTTFNWMYFAWELFPLAFRPLELATPVFIGIEVLFAGLLKRWGGHCWILAQKPGASLFPEIGFERRNARQMRAWARGSRS